MNSNRISNQKRPVLAVSRLELGSLSDRPGLTIYYLHRIDGLDLVSVQTQKAYVAPEYQLPKLQF